MRWSGSPRVSPTAPEGYQARHDDEPDESLYVRLGGQRGCGVSTDLPVMLVFAPGAVCRSSMLRRSCSATALALLFTFALFLSLGRARRAPAPDAHDGSSGVPAPRADGRLPTLARPTHYALDLV